MAPPARLNRGTIYRVTEGPNEGKMGRCTEVKVNDFGNEWAKLDLEPAEPDGDWFRRVLLEEVEIATDVPPSERIDQRISGGNVPRGPVPGHRDINRTGG